MLESHAQKQCCSLCRRYMQAWLLPADAASRSTAKQGNNTIMLKTLAVAERCCVPHLDLQDAMRRLDVVLL